MKLMRLAFRPETVVPMLALVFASGVCVALVIARVIWTRDLHYAFLVWNLFLAWLPLVFALLAGDAHGAGPGSKWRFRGLSIAWLLFFPNAPYIFTDLIHLTRIYSRFWVDLVLILAFALTGWVVGFLSLFLMQMLVRRVLGQIASWCFIAVVAGLSGFGIYVGRFLGFNSWDVVFQPVALCRGIGTWAANPLAHSTSYAFPMLFAAFLFITYVMLYALTHLRHAPATSSETK
jgi:uncharacterized membrane protein